MKKISHKLVNVGFSQVRYILKWNITSSRLKTKTLKLVLNNIVDNISHGFTKKWLNRLGEFQPHFLFVQM